MRGSDLLNDSTLQSLADKHQKTPAQIVLRWHIQSGLIVIPKSVTPARIDENINIFDFELDDADMLIITNMNEDRRLGADPDNF
jgi:diketogulonate reductase-like aldo/keto reductase